MLRQLTDTAKHGLAAGEAPPERFDWTVDQGRDRHTAEEHGVHVAQKASVAA